MTLPHVCGHAARPGLCWRNRRRADGDRHGEARIEGRTAIDAGQFGAATVRAVGPVRALRRVVALRTVVRPLEQPIFGDILGNTVS